VAKAALFNTLASAATPPVISAFGIDIPVAATALGMLSLLLVRYVKPNVPGAEPSTITPMQNRAVTAVLGILLFVIIAGELPIIATKPLEPGMAVIWGIGLGTTGIMAFDLIGEKIKSTLRRVFGTEKP
jgi:hypothetical protein